MFMPVIKRFVSFLFVAGCILALSNADAWLVTYSAIPDRTVVRQGETVIFEIGYTVVPTRESGVAVVDVLFELPVLPASGLSFSSASSDEGDQTTAYDAEIFSVVSAYSDLGAISSGTTTVDLTNVCSVSEAPCYFLLDTIVMVVTGAVGSTVSLSIDQALTRAAAFSNQLEGVTSAPVLARFTPSQLLRIEEPLAETELSLLAPVGARLGTRDNVDADSSTHVLTLTLQDGTDGFPSAIVTSFSITVMAVGGFDIRSLQFSLWDNEDELAQGSHLAGGSIAFQGFFLDAADGRMQHYQIRAFRSGSLPGVSDGMLLEFQLDGAVGLTDPTEGEVRSTFSGVTTNTVASFSLDVQTVDVVLAGLAEWDLVDPYVLLGSGMDGDGNIDDDFGVDSVAVFARLDGEPMSTSPVVLVGSRVPPSAYRADTDGRVLIFTAQGVGMVSSEHRVVVDVTATRLVAVGMAEVSPSVIGVSVSQSVMAVLGDDACNVGMDFPCVRDTNYSGIATAVYNRALSVGVTTPVVSFDQTMIENGIGTIEVTVNSTVTTMAQGIVPQISLWLGAVAPDNSRLLPFQLNIPYQPAFDLDFDGDDSLAGVADFALLFFWGTDRRSYQSERNGGASHEAALRAALQPSVDLGLLNDQNVLVGGEKLLAVLPPTPVLAALLDFDGDNSLAGVADFALLFFWETDRRSYQSERNGGASHEAALRAALQPSVDLNLLNDQNVLVAGEKLLRVLPP